MILRNNVFEFHSTRFDKIKQNYTIFAEYILWWTKVPSTDSQESYKMGISVRIMEIFQNFIIFF